ncbi:MAG: hypothetical protein FGM34_10390, partial [Solirubrobacteraceae bacterium]|nr:hypothetical protein [Solirubrobacteraceae bacterium]
MAADLSRSIVLTGFMGAGKSTLAEALAAQLGLPWSDSDIEVENREGAPVEEIFAGSGEEAFRAAEAEVVTGLLRLPPQVIALGGGALADPTVREML